MMKVVSMLLLCVLTQTMLSPLASAHVTASAMYPSRRMTTTHISMSSNLNSRGYGSSNNNYNNNINNNNYNKNMINNNNMNSDSQQGTDGAEGDMMMTPRYVCVALSSHPPYVAQNHSKSYSYFLFFSRQQLSSPIDLLSRPGRTHAGYLYQE